MIPQWQLRELQKSWGMNIVSAPLQLKGVRRGKQQKLCVLPAAKSWCHTGTAACSTWSQNTCSHGVCQPCVRRIYRGVLVSRGFWIRFGRSVKAHILARMVCEGAHLDPWGDLKTHGIPYWFSLHSLFPAQTSFSVLPPRHFLPLVPFIFLNFLDHCVFPWI